MDKIKKDNIDDAANEKSKKSKEKTALKAKSATLKAKGNSLTGQPLDNIEINPQLDSDKQVTEQSRGGVVLTFGRMNPPTVGHEKLVNKVIAVAQSAKATPLVFLSHSQDKNKNPLEYADKVRFAQAAFGNIVQKSPAKNIIDIAKSLQGKFKELTLVVGADRVNEFDSLLKKYNGKEFNFDKVSVVSAGERDPDAEGVEGMSASKMRAAVKGGDQAKFISGLPKRLKSHGKEVFQMTSAGMQLKEELEAEGLLGEVLNVQQRFKRALIMKRYASKIERARELSQKRMASPEKLKRRAYKKARDVVRRRVAGRRGADYANLPAAEKMRIDVEVEKRKKMIVKIAKRIMPKIKAAEYERLASFMKGDALQHLHTNANQQNEEFNQAFEQFAGNIDIVTIDDILSEMTNLVLEKIITEKQISALEKRSSRSGISYDILEQVYVRGLLDSMGDQNAAFNRVNAFICGGKTAMNEDYDLYQQIDHVDLDDVFEQVMNVSKKSQKLEKPADERKEIEMVRRSKEQPDEKDEIEMIRRAHAQVKKKIIDEHQNLDESFNIAFGAGVGVALTAADLGMKAQGGFAFHPSVFEEEVVDETVKTADKGPVVVPAHKDARGNTIPAKTVMRKKSRVIVNTGDNPNDGK